MIKNLTITNWNQFNDVNIDLHPQVTIITGTNGSGKSTIVRLVSTLLGWEYKEIATPKKSPDFKFHLSPGTSIEEHLDNLNQEILMGINHIKIGSLTSEKGVLEFNVPKDINEVSYSLTTFATNHDSLAINGISIASHRIPYTYSALKSIPVKPMTKGEAYFNYNDALKKRTIPNNYYNPLEDVPTSHVKATLLSLALFGQDNDYIKGDKESYRIFKRFIEILKILLPETLGFKEINIINGEVILVTATGNFLIDSVSGGIGAIIDLAWQIYMYDNENGDPFLVVIDEIENHLHPSMQRNVLPNLVKAFPNAQFIVTTHSPFVVNSVSESHVYALKYNDRNKVCSYKLDLVNKSSDALEILRDILGVPVTLPIWIEEKLDLILEKYRDTELTAQTFTSLKNDLNEIGLSNHIPQALNFLQRGASK
ncbi:TPA: AAA family ATPase [Bacillus cereus]|nr:AAA family ATPase [Bacillus cereus]HDV8369904.1 AAA family ATPase [Bacillus cereus]